jgi:hypothetical protein
MDSSEQNYQRLERLASQWRYVRWFQAVFGVVIAAFGVFLVAHAHKLSAAGTWNEEAITYYPMGMILFVMGFRMFLPALAQWRGDPMIVTLLKLARNDLVRRQDPGSQLQDTDVPPRV